MRGKRTIDTAEAAEDVAHREIEKRRRALIRDSTLKSEASKRALSNMVATLMWEERRLRMKLKDGSISGEESRNIPAVASNLSRTIERLGLIQTKEDEVDLGD